MALLVLLAGSARVARISLFLAVLGLFLGVGACAGSARERGSAAPPATASAAPAPEPVPVVNLDLEPVRVEVARDAAGRTQVSMFDARQLFDQAGAALDADRYDQALTLYDRLVASFPESELVAPALFNGGLALEGKRDLDAAIARYLEVARRSPAVRYGLDAHIRAGALLAELARWSDALRAFEQVLARGDLAERDRIELQARRGYVLVESGGYEEAETTLAAAIELAHGALPGQEVERGYFVAMARYYLAEIPRRQADAVQLRLPEEQLQRDIEAKAKLVLVAQRRYEDTIRLGNLYWATAAGYQLGSMQQEMWRALVNAPVPRQLRSKEAAIYVAEVRALARGHLEKALAAHLMNVQVEEHNKTETAWTQSSRQRIGELRRLLGPGSPGTATPRDDGDRDSPRRIDL